MGYKDPEKARLYINKWMREWRKKNRPLVNARRRVWRKKAAGILRMKLDKGVRRTKIRQIVIDAKDRPCVDCGLHLPPELMDLDHSKGKRSKPKSHGWRTYSTIKSLNQELAKCEVRCPICHRIRHWEEKLRKQYGGQTDRKKVG